MLRYALRDDQWDRIKDFLPGREGHVGALPLTIGCSWMRFSFAIALASPGAIFPNATVTGKRHIGVIAVGAKLAYLQRFSRFWRQTPTMNS